MLQMTILEIQQLIRSTVWGSCRRSSTLPWKLASIPAREPLIISLESRRIHNSSTQLSRGFKWTDEELNTLTEIDNDGGSFHDLANALPNRTMVSIESKLYTMRKFQRADRWDNGELPVKHKESKSRKWTLEEDNRLIEGVNEFGLDWTRIVEEIINGERLGRTGLACSRRWDVLMKDDRSIGVWDKVELDKLHNALLELGKKRSEKFTPKQRSENPFLELDLKSIDWTEVSRRVGTRTPVQCRSHTYKSTLSKEKGPWSKEEIDLLAQGIKQHGLNWNKLADIVTTRSAFQIKQGYYQHATRTSNSAMDRKPGSKFSLDSLMSRALPALDANPAAATDGSKKFKRVRPVEGVSMTTATSTITNSYVNVNPVITPTSSLMPLNAPIPTPTPTPTPIPTVVPSKTPTQINNSQSVHLVQSKKPSIPSDIAAAAASIFAEPQQQNSGSVNNELQTPGSGSSSKRKRKSNKNRKGGQGNVPGTIGAVSTDSKEGGSAHSLTEDSGVTKNQQKNNTDSKKRKKNTSNGGRDDSKNGSVGRSGSKHKNDPKQRRSRRLIDPQTEVRNLDATPELVGLSVDDDFSTLLVQHVEHTNKMIQRDLEKQSKLMQEEQKKQAELLASQAAQLLDPKAAVSVPQQNQQQPHQKRQNLSKGKAPFVPRRDCNYFLKGFCKNDTECTFRHDIEARNAYQAGTLTISEGKVNSDLTQAAMYAM